MKVYSHSSSNISTTNNISDNFKSSQANIVIEKISELKDIFSIIENKINNILILGKKMDQIHNKANKDFENCKVEKHFILKQREEVIKELSEIYESRLLKFGNGSTSILYSISNCIKSFLDELIRLDSECKSQEATIENSLSIIEDLNKSLENKCAAIELIKIKNSAISFVNRQDTLVGNDSFNEEINNAKQLVAALTQNNEFKSEINKLNSIIKDKDKDLLNNNVKLEEAQQKINKLVLDIELSASLAQNQISALQSKIEKYKDQIKKLNEKVQDAKSLLNSYHAYLLMLPVLGGSILGNVLFHNKFVGTLLGGLLGVVYNAYSIDNGKIIFDNVSKLSRYVSKEKD